MSQITCDYCSVEAWSIKYQWSQYGASPILDLIFSNRRYKGCIYGYHEHVKFRSIVKCTLHSESSLNIDVVGKN
jgi:hypothetical protein